MKGPLSPAALLSAAADQQFSSISALLRRVLQAAGADPNTKSIAAVAELCGVLEGASARDVVERVCDPSQARLTGRHVARHPALHKLLLSLARKVTLLVPEAAAVCREFGDLFEAVHDAAALSAQDSELNATRGAQTRVFHEDQILHNFLQRQTDLTERAWIVWVYMSIVSGAFYNLLLKPHDFLDTCNAKYESAVATSNGITSLMHWAVEPTFAVWHSATGVPAFFFESRTSSESTLPKLIMTSLVAFLGQRVLRKYALARQVRGRMRARHALINLGSFLEAHFASLQDTAGFKEARREVAEALKRMPSLPDARPLQRRRDDGESGEQGEPGPKRFRSDSADTIYDRLAAALPFIVSCSLRPYGTLRTLPDDDPDPDRKCSVFAGKTAGNVCVIKLTRRANAEHEAAVLRHLRDHAPVPELLACERLPDGPMALATRFAGRTHFQPQSWREARDAARQTLLALAAAHALGVVHGDLKPEHIAVARVVCSAADADLGRCDARREGRDPHTTLRVQLVDCDSSKWRRDDGTVLKGPRGPTLGFIAQEQSATQRPSEASDLWALACSVRWMVQGLGEGDADEQEQRVRERLLRVLARLEAEEPKARGTAAEAARALSEAAEAVGRGLETVAAH